MASDSSDERPSQGRQSIPMRNLLTSTTNKQGLESHHHLGDDSNPQNSTPTQNTGTFLTDSEEGISYANVSRQSIHSTNIQSASPPIFQFEDAPASPRRYSTRSSDSLDSGLPYTGQSSNMDMEESDEMPLTHSAQPISGSIVTESVDLEGQNGFMKSTAMESSAGERRSNQSRRDLETGFVNSQRPSLGMSLDPIGYRISRSSSTSGALLRAGDMVRALSQRVVNLSGESDIIDHHSSRHRSRSLHESPGDDLNDLHSPSKPQAADESSEKMASSSSYPARGRPIQTPHRPPNPLRGKSLRIFTPENPIRRLLCDCLVHPYVEPFILFLIILQTLLLVVENAPNVFTEGNGPNRAWGSKVIDWIMLGLFCVYTLELVARIIVSGFILNAADYSTIDRKKGVKAAITDQYRAVFKPQRQESPREPSQAESQPSTIARSFTTIMGGQEALPKTVADQQRFQLARRAFLRHSFNRLDFVAVGSYWIAFVMIITGSKEGRHIRVFQMLSSLRILRLLALTNGTAIILRSLKKATPLLVRVAFLMGFFWLLLAIIGVQAFKSSFRRTCTWIDPNDPKNLSATYQNQLEFCGGYIDNTTNQTYPWVKMDVPGSLESLSNGTYKSKGYICPRGSLCLQQENPYNGTISFDNILNSLELVFVIMSANTFTDLMYYTTASDYLQAALFFGAGILFLTLWLCNLLTAVITSSFQVIREESQASAFAAEPEPDLQSHTEEPPRRLSQLQRHYDRTKTFWVVVIAFALLSQGFYNATMSQFRANMIDLAQIAATALLDIEIVIRIAADWRDFHHSWRNLFDLGLAVATSVILIPPIRHSGAYPWLTGFQVLRVYRVVLAISLIADLILLVLGNATGIANLTLFVFLMTFLASIFAAQLFRGEVPIYGNSGFNRVSFYNIYNSFLAMYQILSSENWTNILYDVTAYTTAYNTAWLGATFLIGWFILGNFLLINMFIAVIQENFDVSEDDKRLEQVKSFLQRRELGHGASSNLALSTIFSFGRSRRRYDPLDYGPAMTEMLLKDAVVREFLDDESDDQLDEPGGAPSAPHRAATTLLGGDGSQNVFQTLWGKFVRNVFRTKPNPFYSNIRFDGPTDAQDPRQMARHAVSAASARRKAQREYLAEHPTYNNSLYIFTPKNRLRQLCQRLVGPSRGHERFDGLEPNKIAWYSFSAFIYIAIATMVILACVTTPLYQRQYQMEHSFSFTNWYVWTDLAFATVFAVEAIIKIIADGFIWAPNAYIRSVWGVIDLVVLITLWINVVTLFVSDGAISRAIGAFKALRALRLLNVSESARDTFYALIVVGWWKILGAAFVFVSLLIPFAIYGVTLFSGTLWKCSDTNGDIIKLDSCFGEYDSSPYSSNWLMLAPRTVANPYYNFDDFASSMFTLFQIVSQEGWIGVTYHIQAVTGVGNQPQELNRPGNALFTVAFDFLSTVFILTLFISVFMRNYTEQTGVAFLTAEQRSWVELRKVLRQVSPSKTSYNETGKSWTKWCQRTAMAKKRSRWYFFITCVLVVHLILLVLEYNDEPSWWTTTRNFIFLGLILIYIANIVIRVVGLGWSRYRKSSWDVYALLAVGGALIATIALFAAGEHRNIYTQFHKVFLVGIVLLLIPRNDALDQLFMTAAASLTKIMNLLATWLVLFMVFAIAMTQAFSLTAFGPNEYYNKNFRDVPKALILLFRMSWGEGWNQVMYQYSTIVPPLCVDNGNFFESDCGSEVWARALFVAWNILSMYIFVNLFISLIFESFSYVYQRSSGVEAVDRDEIRRFKEAWRCVDPAGTGFISKETFPRLLSELSGVFQMRIYEPEDSVHQILADVRGDGATNRPASTGWAGDCGEVDIDKLNRRLAKLDVPKIRERRHRFKMFYGEVLVSADPDRGIPFNTVLMILAQYNIINDSKSLRLDEFLKRRARLQRVDEELRRNIVQGFFDTLYWTKRFQKHKAEQRRSRMRTLPRLEIPGIQIGAGSREAEECRVGSPGSADGTSAAAAGSGQHEAGRESRHRPGGRGGREARSTHPLSLPTSSQQAGASATKGPTSGFSFELYEPEGRELRERRSVETGPPSPLQARDMLDDSVWMESIRRSATKRRSSPRHSRSPQSPQVARSPRSPRRSRSIRESGRYSDVDKLSPTR